MSEQLWLEDGTEWFLPEGSEKNAVYHGTRKGRRVMEKAMKRLHRWIRKKRRSKSRREARVDIAVRRLAQSDDDTIDAVALKYLEKP